MSKGETPSRFGSFVGRERELGELRHALGEVRSGHGRVLLISGEPGIGKTRLANEASNLAQGQGIRTVWGRSWAGGGAPAYWPWIQVIRSLVSSASPSGYREFFESEPAASVVETVSQIIPDLYVPIRRPKPPTTVRLDPEQARFRLFDAVATLVRELARIEPIAI